MHATAVWPGTAAMGTTLSRVPAEVHVQYWPIHCFFHNTTRPLGPWG